MDLTELPGRACPVAAALELVGDRWSLLVVREVDLGSHRFSEIQRGTGAPRDRLAARLKALVESGILHRERYSDTPERFDYHLTDAGRELVAVLRALYAWGERWACTPGPGVPATPR
jgi:DNA-binding HxlR family transcriptional regulator